MDLDYLVMLILGIHKMRIRLKAWLSSVSLHCNMVLAWKSCHAEVTCINHGVAMPTTPAGCLMQAEPPALAVNRSQLQHRSDWEDLKHMLPCIIGAGGSS
mmetsp:Transcript_4388/g.12409  ORF Transcript_4388/g.12409 Transcript_4388/m.12409 type:complete len:100 (+) Transcript_4388:746-1045(+)